MRAIIGFFAGLGIVSVPAILLFNIIVGGWSICYLGAIIGLKISMFIGCFIGFFIAEITVPLAFVVWILKGVGIL